jgi:selenocysteine-specific elongation factor
VEPRSKRCWRHRFRRRAIFRTNATADGDVGVKALLQHLAQMAATLPASDERRCSASAWTACSRWPARAPSSPAPRWRAVCAWATRCNWRLAAAGARAQHPCPEPCGEVARRPALALNLAGGKDDIARRLGGRAGAGRVFERIDVELT